jgi:hypothetical protein
MKVSWDDDIPNMMGKIKHVPNHQSAIVSHPKILGLVCGFKKYVTNRTIHVASKCSFVGNPPTKKESSKVSRCKS